MENQKSAIGLDGNIAALIGYPIGIVALVLIFIEKDNKFVRFHAIQSVLWAVFCTVGIIVVAIVGVVLGLIVTQGSETLGYIVFAITGLLYAIFGLGWFAGLIMGAVKAYGGVTYKLPIVGNFAEKWSN